MYCRRGELGELPGCDDGRQRGGIEQHVSKCGNIKKVFRYRLSISSASAEMPEFLPC
jgi:hypothetical protein